MFIPSHSRSVRLVHQQGGILRTFSTLIFMLSLVAMAALGFYAYALNGVIIDKFESRRWDIPATVYSRPLDLKPYEPKPKETPVTQKDVEKWLNMLGYSQNNRQKTGTYYFKNPNKDDLVITTRGFDYGDNIVTTSQTIHIKFGEQSKSIIDIDTPNGSNTALLEPIVIGKIYPDSGEDRELIYLDKNPKAPPALIDALIATEDRDFYNHKGVSVRGTTRAILNNLRGGGMQGGSTLTQQLIKNFYLNSERSLKRKANEAIMALLLERQYSKEAILQAYLNEINLGQNGNQSINGFGTASKFYFNKPIGELRLDQYALLVGVAKGPTYYNPRKHKERALERRNTVLHNMLVMGKITQEQYDSAKQQPLDVVETPSIAKPKFPDFLDYVRRELNTRYKGDDLKNAGLRIITTLDPLAQSAANEAFHSSLTKLKKTNKATKELQGALISANPHTGEVLALVGSGSEFTGFNRALDARRQVGSLLKPVIYLTALQSHKYNLASGVDDSEVAYDVGSKSWTPKNYDGISHGVVPLTTALANSYNQAAVNTGMDIGLKDFVGYLKHLGLDGDIKQYPSTLLGAVDSTPMQMLGLYQVFASGGVYHPLYGIIQVIDEKGVVLEKAENRQEVRIPDDAAYLLNYAMQQVVSDGTAKAAAQLGNVAGKTGTTNDARDAWFAGYSGNYVSVVWVGRDDNKPIGLTGGSGALSIWVNYMNKLSLTPISFDQPETIKWVWLENGTGRMVDETCENAVNVPAIAKSISNEPSLCEQNQLEEQRQAELLAQFGDMAASLEEDTSDTADNNEPSGDTADNTDNANTDKADNTADTQEETAF